MTSPTRERRRVVYALLFASHYREAALRALVASPRHDYAFTGEVADVISGSVEVWRMPQSFPFTRTRFTKFFRTFGWMSGSIRLALRRDVDAIVYVGDPHLLNTWVSAPLARLTGKRVLFYTIGWLRRDPPLRTLMKHIYFRIPHGLLLYGHYAKMVGIERGFSAERLYVVYNNLDYERQKMLGAKLTPERLRAVRREQFEHPQRPVLICTSRLTAKRRLDLVLEAMDILRRDRHDVNLLLVGEGPERARLERIADEKGLAVRFFGACYDETVLSTLIGAANATVAPGMVGLTALHSFAYGVPVITHDDPLHQSPEWEIITPGRNGTFFARDDAADLARAIRVWTGSEFPSDETRRACHAPLKRHWSATFQQRVFDWAVSGHPADDLFWMREDEQVPPTEVPADLLRHAEGLAYAGEAD